MTPFLVYSQFTLRSDDVQEFDTTRDGILLTVRKISRDDCLESLCKIRTRESDQLETVLEMFDIETHQKISKPSYQKLKTLVKKSIEQTLGLRGAVVASRRGLSGDVRGQGVCYQQKAKGQRSRGDKCSFRQDGR